jgi:hypothetical protein
MMGKRGGVIPPESQLPPLQQRAAVKDEDIYGLDICVATPCRCGCPLIRAHPHSVKSKIPIWKCVWCQKRRGKPTDAEIALLNAWLKEYGYTLEPLAFCDDGGIRYAYEVFGRGQGPVARLDEDSTPDRAA